MNKEPVGGRLKYTWQKWKSVKASKKILRWLRRGYLLPFKTEEDAERRARAQFLNESPKDLIANYISGSEKQLVIGQMMTTLLKKGVIIEMETDEQGFFNRVFLRPKKTDASETRMEKRWRLILDVSRLNNFLRAKHFKMETVQVIRNTLSENLWATSVDFSDAYHHIPIHPNMQNFLAFQVGTTRYKYVACPFGLNAIPQVFTELMTPLKVFTKTTANVEIFQYLDDWLILAKSSERVLSATKFFIETCVNLGLLVNLDKSVLKPSQTLTHLGVVWNFKSNTLTTPPDKKLWLTSTCRTICNSKRSQLPLLETTLGKMISVEKVVHLGRINYRAFQSDVLRELRRGRTPRWVRLTEAAKRDMKWWSTTDNLDREVPFIDPKHDTVVTTDASLNGWGAHSNDWFIQGEWTVLEKRRHINELELQAVIRTLEKVGKSQLSNKVILFMIDNKTAVAYINKQGGTRSSPLMRLTRAIYKLATQLNSVVKATHIKGDLNSIADMLSRGQQVLKTEWTLSQENFKWVQRQSMFGPPTVDLFANRFNAQTTKFISPCYDALAIAQDALASPWPKETLYAFPPTTIIDKVLVKIIKEKPQKLLLIIPYQPAATWFAAIQKHSLKTTPVANPSLHQPLTGIKHQNPNALFLALFQIRYTA